MTDPSPNPEHLETLAERLAEEMAAQWQRGERPKAEEFLATHPGLTHSAEAALELVYEELCLRQEHGEPITRDELIDRFPQWRSQLEKLLQLHDLLGSGATRLPEVGETVCGYLLVAELGRGARGRVFLATQSALADRPVVLKITPLDGDEHLSLARLQHTHIVPLYTADHDGPRRLRVLCMPYFGGATWDRLLGRLADVTPEKRSGQRLLEALDQERARSPIALPTAGPARHWLARLSCTQAVCWIGASIAEALAHAHQRGLVHLDVKPSNILLASDGQPMLLDFHLAQPPLARGSEAPGWLGGTPGFMAPELRAALDAAAVDHPLPSPVDHRADIWSLGCVLREALSSDNGRLNPEVSVGLSDVLSKCQADDPGQRYSNAANLASDLQRHLANKLLRGVANRSLAERWGKWRRRQPYSLPVALLLLAVLAASAAVGGNAWDGWQRQKEEAAAALEEGRGWLDAGQPDQAARAYHRGLVAIEGGPFLDGPRELLTDGLRQAEQAQNTAERTRLVAELRALTDRLRVLFGTDWVAGGGSEAGTLESRCRELWSHRGRLLRELGEAVRGDLLDLAVLWTDLSVGRLQGSKDGARRTALDVLAEAEESLGPSHVLFRARYRHAVALGQWSEARQADRRAAALPPRTAWEHYALGREWLRDIPPMPHLGGAGATALAGSLVDGIRLWAASTHLEQAIRLQPNNVWAHHAFAACSYRLGRYHDAIASLSFCIGAAPRVGEFYVARSLAQAALGRVDQALEDHDLACRHAGPLGHPSLAAVHFNLAVALLAKGDQPAARNHLKHALHADPVHEAANNLARYLDRGVTLTPK